MIAWVEGVLRDKWPTRAILDVRGVGYELHIPISTYCELPDTGKTVALHVHTHVREDAIQLYGFWRAQERTLFELLLRANGVGPRLAQTILSGMSSEELIAALRAGDIAALRRVPGLGSKKAERLVLELRDRVEAFGESGAGSEIPLAQAVVSDGRMEQVLSALLNLGYPRAQAEAVVRAAAEAAGSEAAIEDLLRAALRSLSR